MLKTLASHPPPRDHGLVRFAEVLAALVEQAQQRDPSLTVETIAERADVHRVTLAKIVSAAKAGRPRSVDEDTFWDVCRVLGQTSETAFAPELRAVVETWRRTMSLAPTEATRDKRRTKGGA